MSTLFNYDWFSGAAFAQQKESARTRCARKHFPGIDAEQLPGHPPYQVFLAELEVRTLVYLRDGFSYEFKEIVDIGLRNNVLTFECEPVDDQYKVGSFLVSVPFDEIVRVEVFAVHPTEKPEDVPLITGFRSSPTMDLTQPPPREDPRDRETRDADHRD